MTDSVIHQIPFFATLPSTEIDELVATLRRVTYPASTILFQEGQLGDRFYIVLDGEVAIIKALATSEERLLAIRGSGEFVGEMSLLSTDGLRTASAQVHASAQLLELTRADFDALLQRYPMLAYQMLRVLSGRLGQAHDTAIRELHAKNERLAQAYSDLQAAQARIIEQETLARELQLAREIQESMLPQVVPQLQGFDAGARMVAARMVGGDFFDVIALDADHLGLVIGDVSGKGVAAALFMALTCSFLRSEASRIVTPTQVLHNVNQHLLGMNNKGMFVTVLYGVLERSTRTFSYARAGHELPLVWDHQGTLVSIPRQQGLALGLFSDAVFDTHTIILPEGSWLMLYTDGATDATDVQGTFFGLERLRAATAELLDKPAQELCDSLVNRLIGYHGGSPQNDDITLVAVRAGPVVSQLSL